MKNINHKKEKEKKTDLKFNYSARFFSFFSSSTGPAVIVALPRQLSNTHKIWMTNFLDAPCDRAGVFFLLEYILNISSSSSSLLHISIMPSNIYIYTIAIDTTTPWGCAISAVANTRRHREKERKKERGNVGWMIQFLGPLDCFFFHPQTHLKIGKKETYQHGGSLKLYSVHSARWEYAPPFTRQMRKKNPRRWSFSPFVGSFSSTHNDLWNNI